MKEHILDSTTFFSENRAVYEIIRKNIAEPDVPHRQYRKAHALCMLDK